MGSIVPFPQDSVAEERMRLNNQFALLDIRKGIWPQKLCTSYIRITEAD